MTIEEESIEQAAAARRERLKALREAKELLSTPDEDSKETDEDKMAGGHTRSTQNNDQAGSSGNESVGARFNQLMQAFVDSQTAQALNQTQQREEQNKQREDQATFQTQMLQFLQRPAPVPQVIIPPRVTDLNDIYDKFKKRNPPAYFGNEDPLDADEWVVQMEKIFKVFQCSGRERVQLASYMFRGVAELWWKSVMTPYDTIEDAEAWMSFQTLFRAKCIPPHIQAQKLIEFESLVQGEDPVQIYEQKFTNLSRFAPSLVRVEADKVIRFIRGLRPDIQMEVTSVTLVTYEENLKRAYWAEESIRKKTLYAQQLQAVPVPVRSLGLGQFQQRPQQYHQYQQHPQQKYQQQQGKRPRVNPIRRAYCERCGKNSHTTANCRRNTGACFECGSMDHQRRDCPRAQEQGVRNAAPRPPLAAQPLRQAPQQQPRAPQQPQQLRLPTPPQRRGQYRPQGPQRPQGQQYAQYRPQGQQQQQRPQMHGKLFALDQQEGEETEGVVEGTEPFYPDEEEETTEEVQAEQPNDFLEYSTDDIV